MVKVAAGVLQIKNSHGSLSITCTPKGDKRQRAIDHHGLKLMQGRKTQKKLVLPCADVMQKTN